MTKRLQGMLLNESAVAAIVSLICFAVYLTTMCRTVSFIDAGELATVATVLGIAHPTGYPLFTLLAHGFLQLPIGGEEVFRLNVFSSFVVALGVGVFFKLLLASLYVGDLKHHKSQNTVSVGKPGLLFAAATGSLIFGLSTTVWSQSVAVEVYGLHIVLVLLTALFVLKGIRQDAGGSDSIPRGLIVASFLLGLSFANHLTTLLIVPALLYLYARSYRVSRQSLIRAGKLLPFFLLGVTPYLYFPIRGRLHPPLEWGTPVNIERIFWHVSGKQYRNWMFSSFDSAEKQLSYFINHFHSEYHWIVVAVLLVGVWRTFRSNKTMFWFLTVAFVSCLFYSINYDIYDIDSYFLLAYMAAGVFIFFGIVMIVGFVQERGSLFALAITLIVLIGLPVVQFVQNREEVSEADNHLTEDYVHNIFANARPNALVISYQWDYFVAPALYFQIVRKERPDITIIDKELLRRSWYFVNLKSRFPELIDRSRAKVDAFLAELYKFEHDLPYDPRVIEMRYVEMINDFIDCSIETRPVYVGPEIEAEFGQRYSRTPDGLLFRLTKGSETIAFRPPTINYRSSARDNRLSRGLRGIYAKMLTATGSRFFSENRQFDAAYCLEKALLVDPTFQPAKIVQQGMAKGVRPR